MCQVLFRVGGDWGRVINTCTLSQKSVIRVDSPLPPLTPSVPEDFVADGKEEHSRVDSAPKPSEDKPCLVLPILTGLALNQVSHTQTPSGAMEIA